MEIWKPIGIIKGIDYTGIYEISNMGRVRSLDSFVKSKSNSYRFNKGRMLKCLKYKVGYYYVDLSKNGKSKKVKIHRLVALHFINNSENKSQINHKDGNKSNNIYSNLEWCTQRENTIHAYRTKLAHGHKGIKNHMTKLTNEEVIDIYENRNILSNIELSKKYNVSSSRISYIKLDKEWTHITKDLTINNFKYKSE